MNVETSDGEPRHQWTDRVATELRSHGILLDVEYGAEDDDGDTIRALGASDRHYHFVSIDATGLVGFYIAQVILDDHVLNDSLCLSGVPEEFERQLCQVAGWLGSPQL